LLLKEKFIMKKLFILAAVSLLGLTACEKEETPDLTKPVVTLQAPGGDHVDVGPGDSFQFQALITDDVELSQWKFNIHDAAGHTHRVTVEPWELVEVGSVTGKSYTLSKTLTVPDSAEITTYHLEIEATDKAGNAAVPVILEVHVD
jgi:hypothetical protein